MRLGIGRTITITIVATAIVGVLGIGTSIMSGNHLRGIMQTMITYQQLQQESLLTKELQLEVANVWQFITDASLTHDRNVLKEEADPAYDAALKVIDQLIVLKKNDPEFLKLLTPLKEQLPAMKATGYAMFEAYLKDQAEGDRLMDQYDKACDAVIKGASVVTQKNLQDSNGMSKQIADSLSMVIARSSLSTVVTALLCIAVIIVLLLVRRTMVASLSSLVGAITRMKDGDLTSRFDCSGQTGELALLGGAFNHSAASFHDVIDKMLEAINGLIHSIDFLKPNADKTLNNARKQADQAAQVATAAEEMSLTITDISRNCIDAASVAGEALDSANRGKQIADGAVVTVTKVNDASQELAAMVNQLNSRVSEIGSIVSVIEDIADQTNLLALNAAIEAARAGEQGRGFAVVADEVRALADRTIKATKEISDKINLVQRDSAQTATSMDHAAGEVQTTTNAIQDVGSALDNICGAVLSLRDQIAQIATAIEEQSATTAEVSRNVEESSMLAREIETLAESLKAELGSQVNMGELLRSATAGFKTTGSELMILDVAKSDHRIFVAKIGSCLHGDMSLDPAALPDHHTCRFGKWYDTEGVEKCGNTLEFKSIEAPHARIHSLAKEAVTAHSRGDESRAQQIYAELESVSHDIANKLDTLKIKTSKG